MSSLNSLESFIYPLRKTIRFEVHDIYNLGREGAYSKPVTIGITQWCMKAKIDKLSIRSWRFNERSKLKPLPFNKEEEYLQIDLINHKKPGDHIREKYQFRLLHPSRTIKTNWMEPELWAKDYVMLISRSQLLNDGYVNNGIVVIECDVEIVNEVADDSSCFGVRPANKDIESMFQVDYQPIKKTIEMEVELNKEEFTFGIYVDGIPCKIGLEKQENQLLIYFFCNLEDKSEWWRVEAEVDYCILNRINPDKSIRRTSEKAIFKHDNSILSAGSIDWNGLINCEKHGRITLRATIHILNKYGFDEKTGRGIEKPMKILTDAVILIGKKEFYVSRMILSHQSIWFSELFSANSEKTNFIFDDVTEQLFSWFLQLVNNLKLKLEEGSIKELLELLDKFKSDECIKRLDHQLTNIDIRDDMEMLKLIDMYQLTRMKEKYIKKLQDPDELRRIFGHPDIVKLSDELRKELTMNRIPQLKENDNDPYYEYSKGNLKPERCSRGKLQKFLFENEEAKKLMEDPEFQNQGNQILSFLSDKPEFGQMSFNEFSDPSDMIIFNFKDNKIFYSSKHILSNSSTYFMKRFYGPNSKNDDNTIIFDDVTSNHFNVLLNHIYHPLRIVTESNLGILLPISHRFSVTNVLKKCEEYLIKTEDIELDRKEDYAKKYNLEYLMNACKNQKAASQSRYFSLNVSSWLWYKK